MGYFFRLDSPAPDNRQGRGDGDGPWHLPTRAVSVSTLLVFLSSGVVGQSVVHGSVLPDVESCQEHAAQQATER